MIGKPAVVKRPCGVAIVAGKGGDRTIGCRANRNQPMSTRRKRDFTLPLPCPARSTT